MRRQEIIDGTLQVVAALRETGVKDALQKIVNHPEIVQGTDEEILEAYRRYILAAQRYSPAANRVVAAFDLESLEKGKLWVMGSGSQPHRAEFFPMFRAVTFAVEFLPKLVVLLEQEAITDFAAEMGEPPRNTVLTLLLPEGDREFSKPQRLADALLATATLYEAVALFERQPENTLSVVACDSGSDKSFDLLGVAKVIATVKELLLSVWDRVMFFREKQFEQRLELVASSLPILEKVSKLVEERSMGPEEGEMVRRGVIEGVGKFLYAGAMIPEMAAHSQFEPRKLIAAEPKLLTSGALPASDSEKSLTEEERILLDELTKKAARYGDGGKRR